MRGQTAIGMIIVASIVIVAIGLFIWQHWATWIQPNTYSGVISSFTKYKGFVFGKTNYKVEFYGGSNISWPSSQFTLTQGFVDQPVNISNYHIVPGMNCTFGFTGAFLENVSCGGTATKPTWG